MRLPKSRCNSVFGIIAFLRIELIFPIQHTTPFKRKRFQFVEEANDLETLQYLGTHLSAPQQFVAEKYATANTACYFPQVESIRHIRTADGGTGGLLRFWMSLLITVSITARSQAESQVLLHMPAASPSFR